MLTLSLFCLLAAAPQGTTQPANQQPNTSPPASELYRAVNGVTSPTLIYKVEPSYTERARNAQIEGQVRLSIEVNADGQPQNMRVLRSLDLDLDLQAIQAVTQWRFNPGLKDGKPVNTLAIVEVNFRMLKDPPVGATAQVPASSAQRKPDVVGEMKRPEETTRAEASTQPPSQRLAGSGGGLAGNTTLRWSESCNSCAVFLQKGKVIKAVRVGQVLVYASLGDTGKYLSVYLTVMNQAEDRSYNLLPRNIVMETISPRRKRLTAKDPGQLIQGSRRSANRRAAGVALQGSLQAAAPRRVATVRGTYGSAEVYEYDTGAVDRANQRAKEVLQQQMEQEEQLRNYLLFAETVAPQMKISGAVYFDREKNFDTSTITVRLEEAGSTGSRTGPIVIEFPIRKDEMEVQ